MVILQMGGGFYVLLRALERVDVARGQFVRRGSPSGRSGNGMKAPSLRLGMALASQFSMLSSDGTVSRSIRAMVGDTERQGSRMMRKISVLMMGAALGAAGATVALQTDLIASTRAIAANAETYRSLNLFGDIFEKIRTDYVEKPTSGS